jgi:hypothetical protein
MLSEIMETGLQMFFILRLQAAQTTVVATSVKNIPEELCLLGCYAVWLL